jgi:two-component system, OmpR family, sensor histidine kinase KdpD
VDLPSDLPLLYVDAALIAQVLGNLLENAAKFTPPGTLIRLRAQAEAGKAVIYVEDLGTALRSEDFERVFAKFHRATGESAVTGAGLGLAICRAIVSLHGGAIWVEQLPGGGTSFRFTLPLRSVPAVPVEET